MDAFDTRDMYHEYLSARGIHAVAADTPAAALRLLNELRPAVIVTDTVFPGASADGYDFIGYVRDHSEHATTSIIVISGYIRDEDRARALRCGADRFHPKPVLPGELQSEVEAAFAAHRQGRRLDPVPPVEAGDRRRQERRRSDRRRKP